MARRSDGEGTIKKRVLKRANGTSYVRWYARITLEWNGKRKRGKDGPLRKTQKEAHGDLVELKRQQMSSGLGDETQQKLSDYIHDWLERTRRVKKWRTYQTYEGDLRNHVLPYLGHKRLAKISRANVQQMVNAVFDRAAAQGQSGAAVARKARAVLRTALQDAVDLELLGRNPCERIKVPAEPISQIEVWTPLEARRFLETAKAHRLYPLLYTAITTGLRQGELLMLQWGDLHLDDELPFVEIKRTLVIVKRRRFLRQNATKN